MPDIPLYHWSPTARRKQIIRFGFRPAMRPVVSTPGWRPPYTCFADTPSWAWALSGDFHPEVASWDLWQTWLSRLTDPEVIPGYDGREIHEVRAPHRIFKRDIWYVATRVTA